MKSADLPVLIKRSLRTILDDISLCGEEAPELHALLAERRAKVDATCWYLDRLEAHIEKLQTQWIDVLLKKKADLQAAREKRLVYVQKMMVLHDISLLKGDVREIRCKQSPVALQFDEAASAEAWEKYPDFIEIIPPPVAKPSYKWKRVEVLSAIKEGQELSFVKATRGHHLIYKPTERQK